ncbi:hypothetical protein BT96DRAFT_1009791 [Gymnopus androsaceus JB14]|uniref:Serine/threonine-protein kinase TOR n=1 Tax=Gymnopus androsaceus JB14 TaxID=1447944 RepID=A0A6A4GBX7_9AGAR|nr:hypothetical protein BT96DRAFT_1009791 [Gymnopus androsaceus JB14]
MVSDNSLIKRDAALTTLEVIKVLGILGAVDPYRRKDRNADDATSETAVIEAIMSIFKTQGLKSVAFLPQIIPSFAIVTHNSSARYQEFHLQQLAILVGILKQHIRNYTTDLSS